MNATVRNRLLIVALALITGLLIWFAPGSDELSAPVEKSHRRGGAGDSLAGAERTSINTPSESLGSIDRVVPEEVPDVFKAFSWYVPPPPPPPPPPSAPPPPEAPPLPFTFIGQYIEGKTHLLLLSRANRVLTVGVGDVIANTYRVDAFTGGVVEFTYLPLDIKQSLPVGSN